MNKIKTEKQRINLNPRTAIYWQTIRPRHAIGVRRYLLGWSWCCRNRNGVYTFPKSSTWSYVEALTHCITRWEDNCAIEVSYTVEDAIKDYARHQKLHKGLKSEISADRTCTRVLSNLLLRELSSITEDELIAIHVGLVKTGAEDKTRASKASANRTLAIIKACFNFAKRSNKIKYNPCNKVESFKKVDKARDLFLTRGQIQTLLKVTSGPLHNLIHAAVLTGARLGELKSAKVNNFDPHCGVLHVNGKTGERDVVLSTVGVVFFTEITINRGQEEALLLSPANAHWKPGEHSRLFSKAVICANLPKECVFYSLRHFTASMLLKSGVGPVDVATNLGTDLVTLVNTYYKFVPSSMKSQLDEVNL